MNKRKEKYVPKAVILRMPKYHRYLKELINRDIPRVSSKQIADFMGFTASQVRQDLNYFGGFGQQGYGYNVEDLYGEIGKILGLNKNYNIAIVGAGNLGTALAHYNQFDRLGFKLVAIFDISPRVIGSEINGLEVSSMEDFERKIDEMNVEIIYLCTNTEGAQAVADRICTTRARAIFNFVPTDLNVPEDMIVENTYIVDKLLAISYQLKASKMAEK